MKNILIIFSLIFLVSCSLPHKNENVFTEIHQDIFIECLNCHAPTFLQERNKDIANGFIKNHIDVGVKCMLCHTDIIKWSNENNA